MTTRPPIEPFLGSLPNFLALSSWRCVFSVTPTGLFHPYALIFLFRCPFHQVAEYRVNLRLAFAVVLRISLNWETVEMFVRVKHMRAAVQPCLRCGGGGGIRTRPNSRPAGRVRVHPTYHGSGRLASHSNLATAPRCLRLRPDAQRRGDCLGGPAPQPRLPAPLPAQHCRSRQVSPSEHWPIHLARRKPALRLRALGTPSLLSIRR